MIEVTKTQLNCCNSCHSNDYDVVTITFIKRSSIGGTSIMLCTQCRKELKKVLEELDSND